MNHGPAGLPLALLFVATTEVGSTAAIEVGIAGFGLILAIVIGGPALVAPLEFTLSRDDYRALGGHDAAVRTVADILKHGGEYGRAVRVVEGE